MQLTARLDRDRYFWVRPDLTRADHAIALIEVAGLASGGDVVLDVIRSSGIQAIEPAVDPALVTRTPGGISIALGGLGPDETVGVVVAFQPLQASRPGRKRVAVLTARSGGEEASTTLWARVARNGEPVAVRDSRVHEAHVRARIARHLTIAERATEADDSDTAERALAAADALAATLLPQVPAVPRVNDRRRVGISPTLFLGGVP